MNNNKTTKALALPTRSTWIGPAAFALLAFAANSLFCRLALVSGGIDLHSFTAVRLASGAAFLLCLVRWRQPGKSVGGHWKGGVALFLYAWLFSIAYVQLGAGVGALILFGAVQITMFACSWLKGDRVQPRVLAGMLIAFAGLIALLLPGANAPAAASALIMVISGIAWGAYSLIGKGSTNPLADTAGNFLRSLPLLLIPAGAAVFAGHANISVPGLLYALGSGVLASGAGYAVWYGVLKQISAQQAATLQLSVPVIAALGGVMLLSEPLSLRLVGTSVVVLGGVGMALSGRKVKAM
ncbi:DMT family transporter [Pseudomonas sp. 5P_5.1_Bac1]|uniref:DMT family transporter n=1 Tax=Pseudomonas sp. 5P_5.1_Bac1 TaxID=2971616 RepID=UPI0021C70968|nr:DMT family transporter [Pseudomonas sp. 5P_5.1_Bac1]MCU1724039.1 DMT family transporter [Pseudomonas sp. 5P_5.1_Bac1]